MSAVAGWAPLVSAGLQGMDWARQYANEKYPEESQDDHQVEKLVWNHGVPPSHGVIQGAFYPVFGGRELAADWGYTTGGGK
jgi:hypothetical protein